MSKTYTQKFMASSFKAEYASRQWKIYSVSTQNETYKSSSSHTISKCTSKHKCNTEADLVAHVNVDWKMKFLSKSSKTFELVDREE